MLRCSAMLAAELLHVVGNQRQRVVLQTGAALQFSEKGDQESNITQPCMPGCG
jgi:hypothetical protein